MSAPTSERWLTKGEIAEHLGVSTSTVDRLVVRGMPSSKLGEARQSIRRFEQSAVDEWVRENGKDA